MNALAVKVENLGKTYPIRRPTQHSRITDAIGEGLKGLTRRTRFETFRALDDVSLEIRQGEVVGVIGRNGAGKSTLLKVLSRITEPTSGRVKLYGRVGSLLEVGTGFHPELTGRENIYLNGAILGMRRREIDDQFDAIVDFAEVERFLDTPVKRYSSGMYVRLAFAVAAHLNPEILIVDEVLAVGDEAFQRKCLGKMQDVSSREGRTVLFVSHNMAVIKSLCHRAVLLERGKVAFEGSSKDVVSRYLDGAKHEIGARSVLESNGIRLAKLALTADDPGLSLPSVEAYHDYNLCCRVVFQEAQPRAAINLTVRDDESRIVSTICTPEEGIGWVAAQRSIDLQYRLPDLALMPGKYWVDVEVFGSSTGATFECALGFEVQPTVAKGATTAYRSLHGVVRLARDAQCEIDSAADAE